MSAIKDYLFPKLDEKVERIVDIDSIKNIYHLSLVIGLFEFLTIPVFLYITPELGHDAHLHAYLHPGGWLGFVYAAGFSRASS